MSWTHPNDLPPASKKTPATDQPAVERDKYIIASTPLGFRTHASAGALLLEVAYTLSKRLASGAFYLIVSGHNQQSQLVILQRIEE